MVFIKCVEHKILSASAYGSQGHKCIHSVYKCILQFMHEYLIILIKHRILGNY